MTQRIVVLGGGYGGLSFIRHLAAQPGLKADVTLIDRNPYHTLLVECHTVAAGTRPPQAVRLPFAAMRGGFRLHTAAVTGLDAAHRLVLTEQGTVAYDALVVALGSADNTFDIPGVAAAAAFLRSAADAEAIRRRVAALPPRARVVVAGGGLTGVELAAELGMRRLHPSLELSVIEAAPELLPTMPPHLRDRARRRLGLLKVNTLVGARIAGVEGGLVRLQDGGAVPFDLLVWAAGVKGHPLLAAMGLQVDRAGRAVVDAQLRASLPGVWVVGDSAATDLPPTAQAAELHGRRAAAAVAGALTGEAASAAPARFKGFLVSLGHGYGLGQVGGLPLVGLLPALLKRLVELRHRLAVAGLRGWLL